MSLHVLAFAGSLRQDSYNRALLRASKELSPDGLTIEIFDLDDIPLFNADIDTDADRPRAVVAFKEAIGEADGLLIATPEYNHGVTGVLKNAIDWASRPGHRSVLRGQPVGMIGASAGAMGTSRAQEQLKPILESTLSYLMPHPGFLVSRAGDKLDEEGRLTHEATRDFLQDYLSSLEQWIRRFREHPIPMDRAQ
jgi:chromate reductase